MPTFRPLPCDSSGTEGTSGLTALGLKCLLPVAGSMSFEISHRSLNLWDLLTSPPWTAPPVPGKGGRAEIGPGTCLAAPALLSTARASAKLQPPRSRCSGHPGRPRLGPPLAVGSGLFQHLGKTLARARRSSTTGRVDTSLASQLRGSPPCTFLGQVGLC